MPVPYVSVALHGLQRCVARFLCVAKKPHKFLYANRVKSVNSEAFLPLEFPSQVHHSWGAANVTSVTFIVCCMPVLGVSSLNSGRACHGPFFWPIDLSAAGLSAFAIRQPVVETGALPAAARSCLPAIPPSAVRSRRPTAASRAGLRPCRARGLFRSAERGG
jgi:hypothetical protein